MVQAAGLPALAEPGVRARNLPRLVERVMAREPRFGANKLSAAAVEQIPWRALGT